MRFSRDTFYRYRSAMKTGGIEALIDQNRYKPNLKNKVDEHTKSTVISIALDNPALG